MLSNSWKFPAIRYCCYIGCCIRKCSLYRGIPYPECLYQRFHCTECTYNDKIFCNICMHAHTHTVYVQVNSLGELTARGCTSVHCTLQSVPHRELLRAPQDASPSLYSCHSHTEHSYHENLSRYSQPDAQKKDIHYSTYLQWCLCSTVTEGHVTHAYINMADMYMYRKHMYMYILSTFALQEPSPQSLASY